MGIPSASLGCATNERCVSLPAANVAINAATAIDALGTTPENTTDLGNKKLYARVLPPRTTQVQAMEQQNPKFVSVELGANEVLGAISGAVIPGETVVPPSYFAQAYDQILDRVARTVNAGSVLVGLIDDAGSFPAFRTGDELYANRAEFALFGVAVQTNCQNSPNLLFVPTLVPRAVAAAAQLHAVVPFSCAAGSPTDIDYILTPTEVAQVNGLLYAIDQHIQQEAARRGFAYFRLQALYGRPGLKPSFSIVTMMTNLQPYGPYISLDGVHPTALGQSVLADAAAGAINARYHLGLMVGLAGMLAVP